MNVSCTNCGKRYVLSDDKVAGKSSVKIRCKQCQSLISIDVASGSASPASGASSAPPSASRSSGAVAMASVQQPVSRSPWEDEATKAMPALDMSTQWHAMIGGVQQGPFDVKALVGKVSTGEVTLRTYLWKAGMADWKRAADVPEVSSIFAGVKAPPPPPGARQPTGQLPAVPRRDVAVANEMPSPEVTRPRGGNVADPLPSSQLSTQPMPQSSRPSGVSKPVQVEAKPKLEAREPDPEPREAAPAPAKAEQPLNDLFGEISRENATSGPSGLHESPSQQNLSSSAPVDPFAALGEVSDKELPPPGEATKFFIAQAGVNKRNPPWKIALFILSVIGLPTLVLYLLSTFNVVQLPTVTRTTADGQVVQEPFFSPGGVSGLKDILTGDAKRRREEADRREKERLLAVQAARDRAKNSGTGAVDPSIDTTPPPPKTNPAIAADYAGLEDPNKTTKGPRDREKTNNTLASSGLKDDVAGKVVSDNIKSFNLCVEEALRRNPNLKVGSITVKLSVGASGTVKSATIDPAIHENTDWGACMVKAGKRIVFPASDGETDVLVPLKLGVAM